MPTIFTHAVAAAAIGHLTAARPRIGPGELPRGFWLLTILCAVLPDADVVAFDMGLEYGHVFGHRGFTHSILFAVLLGAAMAAALGRGAYKPMRLRLFVHFALVTASHGLLDAFTDEGLGVGFLAPFSAERFFFPWQPLEVAPIGGHGFFTAQDVRGGLRWVEVLWSEVKFVWIPAGMAVLAARLVRR
jgi:inner membrane protein